MEATVGGDRGEWGDPAGLRLEGVRGEGEVKLSGLREEGEGGGLRQASLMGKSGTIWMGVISEAVAREEGEWVRWFGVRGKRQSDLGEGIG